MPVLHFGHFWWWAWGHDISYYARRMQQSLLQRRSTGAAAGPRTLYVACHPRFRRAVLCQAASNKKLEVGKARMARWG